MAKNYNMEAFLPKLDYWITAGDTPAEIEEAYANATGKVPMMPGICNGILAVQTSLPDTGRTS